MASASATSSLLLAPATFAASTPPACPSTLSKKAATGRRRRTVSCRATGGRGDDGLLWLPRRDVLAGLTGVTAGLAGYPDLASAALQAQLEETCRKGEKVTEKLVECTDRGSPCPPSTPASSIVDFKPESAVKRIRQPAHLLTPEYQEKYKEALAKMRALPASNPLSFTSQAAIHEAYCDGHYRYDPTEKNRPFDVHFSWIFAPWHRMYLYFYERALGQLIGDDTFGLPYWNWDTPAGMAIPAIFKDSFANPLYDPNRDPAHLDALIDLDYINSRGKGTSPIPFDPPPAQAAAHKEAVEKNLSTIYHQQIRNGKGARAYLGEKLCSETAFRINQINQRSKGRQDGQKLKRGNNQGSLERMAHTSVHVWAGKPGPKDPSTCTIANGGVPGHDGKAHCNIDMGFLGTAGRDPLFYSHHSNVDRMWHIWSTKLGGKGFNDPEWLDASFVFYDNYEKPRQVRIKFRDVLDVRNLGYTYDAESEKNLPWLNRKPTLLVPLDKGGRSSTAKPPAFPLTLIAPKEAEQLQVVEVPSVALTAKKAGQLQVLEIQGIEYDPSENSKFDVAINVPKDKASKVGPQYCEYAGSFVSVPSSKEGGGALDAKIALVIDDVLDDIGAAGDSAVDVVLVPRAGEIKINLPLVIKNVDS